MNFVNKQEYSTCPSTRVDGKNTKKQRQLTKIVRDNAATLTMKSPLPWRKFRLF